MSYPFKTLLLVAGLGLSGCQHKVWVESVPAGASLSINGERVGATPQELTVTWVPFKDLNLTAQSQGYRPLTVPLHDDLTLARVVRELLSLRWGKVRGQEVRSQHELLFIREHEESGTWTVDDARRN